MNMKRILKVLLVLILTLLVSVLGCSLILRHTKINVKAATNILFSKIPFLNQFVETSSPTSIYNISVIDKQELRTASYNVDFFVSFKQGDDKHIAIYPFIVEAGIDLKSKRISEYDSLTVVTLPNAEISVADITDDGINVIRSSDNLDYNTHIKPVRMALEMRAKDLAIEHGILSNANKVAEDYLTNLFNKSPLYVFQKEAAPHDTTTTINATLLPIEFNYRERNLEKGYLKFKTDSLYKRDNLEFTSHESRFGFIENSKDFSELESEITSPNSILCKYVDPIDPRLTRLYFDASDDYRKIYVVTNDEAYYIESLHQGSEVQRQIIAPDMLYLAMGVKHTGEEIDEGYNKWLKSYNQTYDYLSDTMTTQYYQAEVELGKMEVLRDSQNCKISAGELLMKSFTHSYIEQEEEPIKTDNEIVDNVQGVIYILRNDKKQKMTPDFQAMVLGLDNEILNDDQKRKMKQIFYVLPDSITRLQDREKYKDDLISNSPNYNRALGDILRGKDFCEYLYSLLKKFGSDILILGEEQNKPKPFQALTIVYHPVEETHGKVKRALNFITSQREEVKEMGGYQEMKEHILAYDSAKPNEGQLALRYVEKGIAADYNILIIEKDSCFVLTNLEVEKNTFESRCKYSCCLVGDSLKVFSDPARGVIKFPKEAMTYKSKKWWDNEDYLEYKDYALAKLLNQMMESYEIEDEDFNKKTAEELIFVVKDVIVKECYRPSLNEYCISK